MANLNDLLDNIGETVTLTNEDGSQEVFEIYSYFNFVWNGVEEIFAVLLSTEVEESGVIMAVGEDENGTFLFDIEDEEKFDALVEHYESLDDEDEE